jgi:uncharacterized phage protein gp47/JayE
MTLQSPSMADIETKFVRELRRSGLTYFSENSKGRALAKVLAREITNSSEFHIATVNSAFAKYATGDMLEAICWIFGLKRENATKATSYAWEQSQRFYVEDSTFGFINGGSDITIPAGTSIYSASITGQDEAIYYKVVADTVLPKADNEAFVTVEATNEGLSSNVGAHVLRNHNFASYADYTNDTLLASNEYAIVNGQNRQADAELRYQLSIAATAHEAANDSAIRYALLSIPGLTDFKVIPFYDGIGTTGAFVVGQGNECPPSMLAHAQQSLLEVASNACQAWAYAPPQLGIAFSTQINMTRSVTANEQNDIASVMSAIISEEMTNLRIGEALNLKTLMKMLLQVDPRISSFGLEPETSPFDELYIYRESDNSGEKVREEWLDVTEISGEDHEVVVLESSIASPITFTWQVYE